MVLLTNRSEGGARTDYVIPGRVGGWPRSQHWLVVSTRDGRVQATISQRLERPKGVRGGPKPPAKLGTQSSVRHRLQQCLERHSPLQTMLQKQILKNTKNKYFFIHIYIYIFVFLFFCFSLSLYLYLFISLSFSLSVSLSISL